MRKAKLVTPAVTASSLLTLLGIQDVMRGTEDLLLQTPTTNTGNISIGSAEAQPGYIIPGGAMSLEKISLKTTYARGDGVDTLIILVLR